MLNGRVPGRAGSLDRPRARKQGTSRIPSQCFKCGAKANQLDLWVNVHEPELFDAAGDYPATKVRILTATTAVRCLSDDYAFHLLLVSYQQLAIRKCHRCPVLSGASDSCGDASADRSCGSKQLG
jgi:hypothetical protein